MKLIIAVTLIILSTWFAFNTGYRTASYDYDAILYNQGLIIPSNFGLVPTIHIFEEKGCYKVCYGEYCRECYKDEI